MFFEGVGVILDQARPDLLEIPLDDGSGIGIEFSFDHDTGLHQMGRNRQLDIATFRLEEELRIWPPGDMVLLFGDVLRTCSVISSSALRSFFRYAPCKSCQMGQPSHDILACSRVFPDVSLGRPRLPEIGNSSDDCGIADIGKPRGFRGIQVTCPFKHRHRVFSQLRYRSPAKALQIVADARAPCVYKSVHHDF